MKATENIQVEMIQGLVESLIAKVGYEQALEMCSTNDEVQVVNWVAGNLNL